MPIYYVPTDDFEQDLEIEYDLSVNYGGFPDNIGAYVTYMKPSKETPKGEKVRLNVWPVLSDVLKESISQEIKENHD